MARSRVEYSLANLHRQSIERMLREAYGFIVAEAEGRVKPKLSARVASFSTVSGDRIDAIRRRNGRQRARGRR